MKILHTADIHLGVKNTKLPQDRQNLLKDESIYNIRNFFDMAKREEYEVILICGDLFHSKSVSSKIVKSFFNAVEEYACPVIYISGNHDESFNFPLSLPENFVILDKNDPSFAYDNFVFYSKYFLDSFQLDENKNNILLIHGNIENSRDSDFFDINKYLNLNFDYIALGHVHAFKQYQKNRDINIVYFKELQHFFDQFIVTLQRLFLFTII